MKELSFSVDILPSLPSIGPSGTASSSKTTTKKQNIQRSPKHRMNAKIHRRPRPGTDQRSKLIINTKPQGAAVGPVAWCSFSFKNAPHIVQSTVGHFPDENYKTPYTADTSTTERAMRPPVGWLRAVAARPAPGPCLVAACTRRIRQAVAHV